MQFAGIDLVLGCGVRMGVDYGPPWPEVLPVVPAGKDCFGAGAGGSPVIADADRRLTFTCVMNKMIRSVVVAPVTAALVEQSYDILKR